MPVLAPRQAFETSEPRLVVENRLALGRHRFRLEVIDEQGNVSLPDDWVVEVREPSNPFDPLRPPVRGAPAPPR